MPPLIIPVFVLHQGCPHRCIYCNEEKAVGSVSPLVTADFLREKVSLALRSRKRKGGPLQIAFYGGNFTGMLWERQRELLEMANVLIRQGLVQGIRISTRPDYIAEENLKLLKALSVQTVEIGAQSLADDVLLRSRRGHRAADVRFALELLKSHGFETGLHLMVGLPGDSPAGFARTVESAIALTPHTVRIHPTLVLAGTELAEMWRGGDYEPLSMAAAIAACKQALVRFAAARIPVIRLGLQSTPALERPGSILAGPCHPAFRSVVEESLFFDVATRLLGSLNNGRDNHLNDEGGEAVFSVSPGDISSFRGSHNRNLEALRDKFPLVRLAVAVDPEQPRGWLTVAKNGQTRRAGIFGS